MASYTAHELDDGSIEWVAEGDGVFPITIDFLPDTFQPPRLPFSLIKRTAKNILKAKTGFGPEKADLIWTAAKVVQAVTLGLPQSSDDLLLRLLRYASAEWKSHIGPVIKKLQSLSESDLGIAEDAAKVLLCLKNAMDAKKAGDAEDAMAFAFSAGSSFARIEARVRADHKVAKLAADKKRLAAGSQRRSMAASEKREDAARRMQFLIDVEGMGTTEAVEKCHAEGLGGKTLLWSVLRCSVRPNSRLTSESSNPK